MARLSWLGEHVVTAPVSMGPGSVDMSHWLHPGSWFQRRAVRTLHQPARETLEELPVEPEKPWGCGWFDSSLDLRLGLAVIEFPGIDLGLAVDLMLSGEQGGRVT